MPKKIQKTRQRAVALGLAHGLSQIEAVKQAGYADSTAEKKAFQIVRRPQIQNFLTDALEALGVTATQIMQPIKDGLEACEVVQTKDGKMLTDFPDHRTRLMAHDRVVTLYGLTGKQAESDASSPSAPPVHINVVFVKPRTSPTTLPPGVKFIRPGPR